MNIASVMQEIAYVVGTSTDLGVYEEDSATGGASVWYPAKVEPPAFIMLLPNEVDPRSTYGRGMAEFPVEGFVVASLADMQGAVETITKYSNGSGENSIIEAVEKASYQSCDVVTVDRLRFEPVTLHAVIYLAARFTFTVRGSGRQGQ